MGLIGGQQLSLVSWNLLAPAYASPTKYSYASRSDLSWPRRQARIVERLAEIDADVVCLQEVETALWEELLGFMQSLGYDGVLQETSRGHPVANAVCFRSGTLEVMRTESRSRALITVLRAREAAVGASPARSLARAPAPPLYLANLHLEASADKGAQRLAQLRSLLRRLELQAASDAAGGGHGQGRMSSDVAVDASNTPIVLAGDHNFDRSSELHTFLSTGEMPAGPDANGQRRPKTRRGQALLPLRDAYLKTPPPWGPKLRSSYRNGRILDFVWTSDAVDVLRTMPVCELAGSSQPHQLPSNDHPSDHLPVGALLSWPGAPASNPIERRPPWQQLFVESVVQRRPKRKP
jgi:endonuclease/exonuclease/phosphatase family metal-dependent hydrolase